MELIAVTDIFGKTEHFDEIVNHISEPYTDVDILDPYSGETIDFENEKEAYEHFQKEMGVEKYSANLFKKLQGKENSNILLLGFSVGASAIWNLSTKLGSYKNTKAIGFYSSQIRNYLHIDPEISIDLYFSNTEPTYNVAQIANKLSKKGKVNCYKTDYSHGFMNRKSVNFDSEGCSEYLKIIKKHTQALTTTPLCLVRTRL